MTAEPPAITPSSPVEKEAWEAPHVLASAIANDTEYYTHTDDVAHHS